MTNPSPPAPSVEEMAEARKRMWALLAADADHEKLRIEWEIIENFLALRPAADPECKWCAQGIPVQLGQHFIKPPGHFMYSEPCTASSPSPPPPHKPQQGRV